MFFIRTSIRPLEYEATDLLPEDRMVWEKDTKTYYIHRDGIILGFSFAKNPKELSLRFYQPTKEDTDIKWYFQALVHRFGHKETNLDIQKKIEDEQYIIFSVAYAHTLTPTS